MKCPICELEMTEWEDYHDGQGFLLESYQSCPTDHYSCEYHHGYYEIKIGDEMFYWNYWMDGKDVGEVTDSLAESLENFRKKIRE